MDQHGPDSTQAGGLEQQISQRARLIVRLWSELI
jgi:hypothetical protein